MPFRLSQCSAVYLEMTEGPSSHKLVEDKPHRTTSANAKPRLFGDDFPSLASEQAEMSRGITKNLAQTTGKPFSRRSNCPQFQSKHLGDTFTKYQSTGYSIPSKYQSNEGPRSKKWAFFVLLPRREVGQSTWPLGEP